MIMGLDHLTIPENYQSKLGIIDTERAIKKIKDTFECALADALSLIRVSAPLFVKTNSGLNDTLSGIERPVAFDVLDLSIDVQIVHSLAKWKRIALKRYGFHENEGIYTDMNVIRRDEQLDNLHSIYVDQWDWEKVITNEQRNLEFLKNTVHSIMAALKKTEEVLLEVYPFLESIIPNTIFFITSQELENRYPNFTDKQREDSICQEHKAVFIMQIGKILASGKPHDSRAPDYDDWELNGDILLWYPVLNRAVEVSSMGIRVDADSLLKQLKLAGAEDRKNLNFHTQLLANELPLTMGGGIGQSRICMLLLGKAHIGEVQATIWSEEMIDFCSQQGIALL
ncbi:MAG: aspartate--ammonia ligase [Oscillospiraceae bacterium]